MPITLGKNLASLRSQRALGQTTQKLGTVFERLASGQRINRAADDAAGLAIASDLNLSRRVYNQGVRNLNDGISLISIADQSVARLTEIVTRQKELAEQSANGVYSQEQRDALDAEAQALRDEFNRIVDSTEFNELSLFSGDITQVVLQGGYGEDGTLIAETLGTEQVIDSVTDAGTSTDETKILGGATYFGIYDSGLLVGDLNQDGYDDVVSLRMVGRQPPGAIVTIKVFLGNEDGTGFVEDVSFNFNISELNPTGGSLSAALVDDDGDGDLDIHFSGTTTGDIGGNEEEIFDNLLIENGSFGIDSALNDSPGVVGDATYTSGTHTGVGDFNGDGISDDLWLSSGNTNTFEIRVSDVNITYRTDVEDMHQDTFNLRSQAGALIALEEFTTELEQLAQKRGSLGAAQSRVEVATNVLRVASENFATAESRIMDADVAAETAELVKANILRETVAAILAQANQQPALALSLLTTE